MNLNIVLLVLISCFYFKAFSKDIKALKAVDTIITHQDTKGEVEELDPFDPNVEQLLEEFDQIYEQEMGISPNIKEVPDFSLFKNLVFQKSVETCVRKDCPIWAQIVKSTQTLYLYVNGELAATWKVSTGLPGSGTPNMDRNPNGRIYDRYTSNKFPGGNYRGLGNMPYAVFIQGGFAIHGTPESNWKKLGQKASHGCVRIHPDNAFYFNRLVRQNGIKNVWITIQE